MSELRFELGSAGDGRTPAGPRRLWARAKKHPKLEKCQKWQVWRVNSAQRVAFGREIAEMARICTLWHHPRRAI